MSNKCEHGNYSHDCALCNLTERAETAERELAGLRVALEECNHQTQSMRVWGGMAWTYQTPQVAKIAEVSRAALNAIINEGKT